MALSKGITDDTLVVSGVSATGTVTTIPVRPEWNTVTVQAVGTYVGTYEVQVSLDGSNFVSAYGTALSGIITPIAAVANSNSPWSFCVVNMTVVRVVVTAYTSGTPSFYIKFSSAPIPEYTAYKYVTFPTTPTVNTANTSASTTTNGAIRNTFVNAATNNLTVVKTTAAKLYYLQAGNSNGSAVYVKIFNAAAVTMGSTVPVMNFYIPPASSIIAIPNSGLGISLLTGFCFAITAGAALLDNTALSTAAVITLNYNYI